METLESKKSINWDLQPVKVVEGENFFTQDQLIDAYLKGKEYLRSRDQEMFIKQLESNLELAKQLSETIFEAISAEGFNCKIVRLKIKDIYSFTGIFIIDAIDYRSKIFRKIYDKSIQLKKEKNSEKTFDFSTIFTPYNQFLEENKLVADGYTLSYNVDSTRTT